MENKKTEKNFLLECNLNKIIFSEIFFYMTSLLQDLQFLIYNLSRNTNKMLINDPTFDKLLDLFM